MGRFVASVSLAVLLLFGSRAVAGPASAQLNGFTLNARSMVAGFAALVEADLDGVLGGARTLAATRDARSGDWGRIKGPLAVYARAIPWAAAVWYGRPDGSYYTLEKGPTDQNVKDRAYFPHLMAGEAVEGVLVVSRSTGKKSVVVAAPVMDHGKAVGVIGVSIGVEKLAARLDRQLRLPSNVVFYALDRAGQTALHRDSALMFDYPTAQNSPTLTAATRTMLSKPEGVVRYRFRNTRRTAAFRASPRMGWVFVLAQVRPLPQR